jgi:paraquat-inducible protein B
MSRAQPRLIGLFVLGAIALIVAGIASMSARRLFAEYRTFVVFFPYAVGGLREGSQVTFRQVQVGHVRDVDLVFVGPDLRNSWIMAVVEIRRNALRDPQGRAAQQSDAELARVMIEAGLRASVRSSSFIAGQRSVDLDFNPEQKPRLSGISTPYPEIPTAPTGMELINERVEATLSKISDVPIDEVILQLNTTLATLQRVLEQSNAPGTTRELRTTLTTMTKTLQAAEKAITGVEGTTGQAQTTLQSMDATMKSVQKTLDRLDRTLATVERGVEGTGDLRVEASRTLEEMNELLKSLRSLVETLQQRPESLLRGRPAPPGRNE